MADKQQIESLWCIHDDARPHIFAVNLLLNSEQDHGPTDSMERLLLDLGARYLTRYPAGSNCDVVIGHCRLFPPLANQALQLIASKLAQGGIYPTAFRINGMNS